MTRETFYKKQIKKLNELAESDPQEAIQRLFTIVHRKVGSKPYYPHKDGQNIDFVSRVAFKYALSIIEQDVTDSSDLPSQEVPELPSAEEEDCDAVVLVNDKKELRTYVSSDRLSEADLEKLKASDEYDLIIHGLSRMVKAGEFTKQLLFLASKGIKRFEIGNEKEAATRLFRDFDIIAIRNLMFLPLMADVIVDGKKLETDVEILQYVLNAANITENARTNQAFAQLSAEYMEEKIVEIYEETKKGSKERERRMNWLTGSGWMSSFSQMFTRAIVQNNHRTESRILDYFHRGMGKKKMAMIPEEKLRAKIVEKLEVSYERLAYKHGGMPVNHLKEILPFNVDILVNGFQAMMRGLYVEEEPEEICDIAQHHHKIAKGEDCWECGETQ